MVCLKSLSVAERWLKKLLTLLSEAIRLLHKAILRCRGLLSEWITLLYSQKVLHGQSSATLKINSPW